jgi:Tol biopolymer transport system component
MVFGPTPSGSHLVYADLERGGEVTIRELATGESRHLTHNANWYAWGAAVSPDGRTVSYLMAEPDVSSLNLVEIDGSGDRVLHREPGCAVSNHAWTSDARHIVAEKICGDEQRVVLISVVDGDLQLVRELEDSHLEGIATSPDGRYAVYGWGVPQDGGNFDIRILALDGSGEEPLVQHPANDRLLGWVPGTDYILFSSDRDGTTDMWALRVSDGVAEGPARMIQRNMGHVEPLGMLPDGSLFYSNYTRWFSTRVAPIDLETGRVVPELGQQLMGSNMPASWSPDGGSLAFVVEQEGPTGSDRPYRRPLHLRDMATGEERALPTGIQARGPTWWSPDGKAILVNGWHESGNRDDHQGGLYLVDVSSGRATLIVDAMPDTRWNEIGATWSSDSAAIMYSQYDPRTAQVRLVWKELPSGEERELHRAPRLSSRHFDLSPDGHQLAFIVKASTQGSPSIVSHGGHIWVMDLDDGAIRATHEIREPGRVSSLQWTPDGNHLLYAKKTEDSSTAVWRVPAGGGDAEELWRFEEDHFNAYLRLSPDGQRVAYTTYHQEVDVWVMENIKEALAAIR